MKKEGEFELFSSKGFLCKEANDLGYEKALNVEYVIDNMLDIPVETV